MVSLESLSKSLFIRFFHKILLMVFNVLKWGAFQLDRIPKRQGDQQIYNIIPFTGAQPRTTFVIAFSASHK